MVKSLPKNWTRLWVADVLGRGNGSFGSYPNDLRIRKRSNSVYLYALWLPNIDEDPRPGEGRINSKRGGAKGKRTPKEVSTGTTDPVEAAKRAIQLHRNWVSNAATRLTEKSLGKKTSLIAYWDQYWSDETNSRASKRNPLRSLRDEKNKWDGEQWGLKHQDWASKSINQITHQDLKNYFLLLEQRAERNPTGGNGSGVKAAQKTLLRKLFDLAADDFPGFTFPNFPVITKQDKEVVHLTKYQWKRLLTRVNELSGGNAVLDLNPSELSALEWRFGDRKNKRNWVDLYDALVLEYYFFLRAEDMPRIKSEWFRFADNNTVKLRLDITKRDRDKYETTHYRPEGADVWKRTKKRKPTGYVIFPHIKRDEKNPENNVVLESLNFLLKTVINETMSGELSGDEITWTNIRHTAFRLTLEAKPELGQEPYINDFARNGHTSSEMLRKTYLKHIQGDVVAESARKSIPRQEIYFAGGRVNFDLEE